MIPAHSGRWLAQSLLVGLAYYVTGRLGLSIPYVDSHITLIWAPSGIALAALLRWGGSLWPAIWLGAFAVNLSVGSSPALAFGIACGNTLGPWLAATMLRQQGMQTDLGRRRDFGLYLLLGVLVGMAINASNGTLQLRLAGLVQGGEMARVWGTWWLGDAMGALVCGIPLLTLQRSYWRTALTGRKGAESLAVVLLLLLLGELIFGDYAGTHVLARPVIFLPFFLLSWLAIRGGVGLASTAALLLALQAVWATANGYGPFHTDDIHFSLAMLWGYMATATIITVLITVLVGELRINERRVMLATAGAEILVWDWHIATGRVSSAGDFDAIGQANLLAETRWADWLEAIHSDDRGRVEQALQDHLQGRSDLFEQEYRVRGSRGGWEWLASRGQVVERDLHRVPTRMAGALHNISERKRGEEALKVSEAMLRQSEERYRQLLNHSPVGILHYDRELIVTYVNRRFAEIMQVPHQYMLGLDCHQLRDHAVLPALKRALLDGQRGEYDGPYLTSYGQLPLTISMVCAPVKSNDGEVIGGIAIIEDITLRKKYELELSKFKFFSDNASDMLYLIDDDTRIRYVSQLTCEQLGYSEQELLQMTIPDLDPHYSKQRVQELLARCRNRQIPAVESYHRCKDGRLMPVEITIRGQQFNGEWLSFSAVRDISARKQMEAEQQRQKAGLAALNEVAALAHLPLEQRLHQALAVGAGYYGLALGIVSRVVGDIYTVQAQVSPPGALQEGQVFHLGDTYCAITLAAGEVVAIAEMGRSEHLGHPCYEAFKLEAYIGAPIYVRGLVYGTVNFSSAEPYSRQFDQGDREFISLLARWLGSSLEREQSRRELAASEAYLKTIIDNEPECVKVIAPDGTLLQMNPAGLAMLQVSGIDEINAVGLANFVLAEHREAFEALNRRVLEGGSGTLEFRVEGKRGQQRWLDTHAAPLRDESGAIWAVLSVTRDITGRMQADSQRRLAASVFTHAHEGIMICNAGQQIVDVNPAFTLITGYTREEVLDRNPNVLSSGRHNEEFYQRMWSAIARNGFWEGELWNRRKDGEVFAERLSITTVADERGRVAYYIGSFSDITLLKEQQTRLERLAHYDDLTELPNRVLLADRLEHALASAQREGHRVAVCYLDLDGFKAVNDELGHDAGDDLLVEVARRLKQVLRAADTVARLGGDEFVLLLVGIDRIAECDIAIRRVLTEISTPVAVSGEQRQVSGSIGIALYPEDGADPDTLLRHADQAMYLAKRAGKNRYVVYGGNETLASLH